MLRLSKTILRTFCTSPTPSTSALESESSKPIMISTSHLEPHLKEHLTAKQRNIRAKMRYEWYICSIVAWIFYANSEDIVTGSWFTNNMFYNTHDKHPYHIRKSYEEKLIKEDNFTAPENK